MRKPRGIIYGVDERPPAAVIALSSVQQRSAMKRPANLVYGLEDSPPAHVTLFNGVQYVGLIAINLVYPLLVFRVAETPVQMVGGLLAIGMLVLGTATFLQARRFGPVGSGYM
ncbi:MAG: hypothetical protein ACREUP_01540, partial [Burkholderiales bacterium]